MNVFKSETAKNRVMNTYNQLLDIAKEINQILIEYLLTMA